MELTQYKTDPSTKGLFLAHLARAIKGPHPALFEALGHQWYCSQCKEEEACCFYVQYNILGVNFPVIVPSTIYT